jgi:hypothetical protein
LIGKIGIFLPGFLGAIYGPGFKIEQLPGKIFRVPGY